MTDEHSLSLTEREEKQRECEHDFVTSWPRYRECVKCGYGMYEADCVNPKGREK